MVKRASNGTPKQGDHKLNLQNNENVCERVPATLEEKHQVIVSTHPVDKSLSKDVTGQSFEAATDQAVTDAKNTPASGTPSRRSQNGVTLESSKDKAQTQEAPPVTPVNNTKSIPVTDKPNVTHEGGEDEIPTPEEADEMWSYEGSPERDKFTGAKGEEKFDSSRSNLVTGHSPPVPPAVFDASKSELVYICPRATDRLLICRQQNSLHVVYKDELEFLLHHSYPLEQEPCSESIPLPFL